MWTFVRQVGYEIRRQACEELTWPGCGDGLGGQPWCWRQKDRDVAKESSVIP